MSPPSDSFGTDARYSPQELRKIFENMAGAGLWTPQIQSQHSPYIGPAFAVYLRYSEVFPQADVRDRDWELLQEVPAINAIGVLASINNLLAITGRDQAAHRTLHEAYLEPELAELVAKASPPAPAFGVVLHRLGNMVAMRDLLLYRANRAPSTDLPITRVGLLALLAIDFVDRDPLPSTSPSNLELAAQVVRTWDIYNPRDLAYAMTRMYHIFTAILPGDAPQIRRARDRVGMKQLAIDGLALSEFAAVAFALFAFGNVDQGNDVSRVLIRPETFFSPVPEGAATS
jgi:hypothetical protein